MECNYNFKISVEGKNYEFDLNAKSNNLSSVYSVTPVDNKDRPAIKLLLEKAQVLFKNEHIEKNYTVDSLADRLAKLPGVLNVEMTPSLKIHNIGIPILLGKEKKCEVQKSLDKIGKILSESLKKTCPKGAGSIVMISRPNEGAKVLISGSCSVDGQPVNGMTTALIGSGAKMFTSLCCMAMINQKLLIKKTNLPLTLDTKISDVFSEKQMLIFDDLAKAKELTLGMLLSHTSGLVYFANDNQDEREGMSLINILENQTPGGSVKFYGHPGDKIYSYSNHISLAAAMLEIAFDMPYSDILKNELLLPLGMNRTSYNCPADDNNVLQAYKSACPEEKKYAPSSVKVEVKDPMMQGAGGLWSCMDDMANLGKALGQALSEKGPLIGVNNKIIISKENLQNMISSHAVNASCGLAFELKGDVIGKGGGIHGYDFKFEIDTKSGSCVSMMCNYARDENFTRYLETTSIALRELNPSVSFSNESKKPLKQEVNELSKQVEVNELSIMDCSQQFKGFSGFLAFPIERPLTQINFNGTTLPLEKLADIDTNSGVVEGYLIVGDSPFEGKELLIYKQNGHLYPCFSEGMEVWSFGEIPEIKFPVINSLDIFEKFKGASGNYIDTNPGGPPPYQVRVDSESGLALSFPGASPSKCLITSWSDNEISFFACIGGNRPQGDSFKLIRAIGEDASNNWELRVFNAETNTLISELPQTKI